MTDEKYSIVKDHERALEKMKRQVHQKDIEVLELISQIEEMNSFVNTLMEENQISVSKQSKSFEEKLV